LLLGLACCSDHAEGSIHSFEVTSATGGVPGPEAWAIPALADGAVPLLTRIHNGLVDGLVLHHEYDGDAQDSSGLMHHATNRTAAGMALNFANTAVGSGSAYFDGVSRETGLGVAAPDAGAVGVAATLGTPGTTQMTLATWLFIQPSTTVAKQVFVEQRAASGMPSVPAADLAHTWGIGSAGDMVYAGAGGVSSLH
jgi:hypothetical protein